MFAPDFESKLILDTHDRWLQWPDEWRKLETFLRERASMVREGVRRCPDWFQEELNTIDPKLRAWWDAWTERWIIDRLQDEGVVERLQRVARDEGDLETAEAMEQSATGLLKSGRYYLTILQFSPTPTMGLDRQLLNALRKADMQRFETPSAFLAQKRAEAEKVQKENDRKATEKVLGAVDKLSTKQLEQFIAVETAIQNGETITAHGSDAKYLEQAQADRQRELKRREAAGESLVLDGERDVALNPGMHPRIYQRGERKERQ